MASFNNGPKGPSTKALEKRYYQEAAEYQRQFNAHFKRLMKLTPTFTFSGRRTSGVYECTVLVKREVVGVGEGRLSAMKAAIATLRARIKKGR